MVQHHYAGTFPAAVHRYGLFDDRTDELLGVAVYGVPMSSRVLTKVLPDLQPVSESLECSRFVLLDGPGNQESWFIARVAEQLAAVGVRGAVLFADPVQRRTAAGELVAPGHVGTIYQASNFVYTGRGSARTLIVLPDGTTLTDRAVQKVRRQERGHAYVERRLVSLGAPAPRAFEDPRRWLACALDAVKATRLRHRGNHRYVQLIGTPAERRHVRIAIPGRPYPKHIDNPSSIQDRLF